MDSSFRIHTEWIQARKKQESGITDHTNTSSTTHKANTKWQPPAAGAFKINVDASVFPGAKTFSIGMVLRDHEDEFIAARTHKISGEVVVCEAEAIDVREALSWIKEMRMQEKEVTVESDSQLTVNTLRSNSMNYLEVGEIIESCKQSLGTLHRSAVVFIRKNANRVAHEVARIPCLVNSRNLFTSPPTCLLEALSYDCLK